MATLYETEWPELPEPDDKGNMEYYIGCNLADKGTGWCFWYGVTANYVIPLWKSHRPWYVRLWAWLKGLWRKWADGSWGGG
jgi:hypothetical protein